MRQSAKRTVLFLFQKGTNLVGALYLCPNHPVEIYANCCVNILFRDKTRQAIIIFIMASNYFTSQTRRRVYKYACVYFTEEKRIATVKTKDIEGYDTRLTTKVGDMVSVKWPIAKMMFYHEAEILFLHSK